MLLELKVENLAIIESVEIQFGPGLNVITGETGAGKSILLAALNLVLGGRSDKELIRTGKEEAWAQALFDTNNKITAFLKDIGIASGQGEPVSLRRIIGINGRSKAYVNCVSVPAGVLKQLAPLLVDFGRQHEQSVLLHSEKHLDLLDRYAGLEEQKEAVEKLYKNIRSLEFEYGELKNKTAERADRIDFLQFQRKNIMDINPQKNEEEELTKELERLSNVEDCKSLAQKAQDLLGGEYDSVREKLSQALEPVKELSQLDEDLDSIYSDLDQALIAIEEAALTLKNYKQNLFFDSQQLEEVEERLEEIVELQNKYGGSFETLTQRLSEIRMEIEKLEKQNERLGKLDSIIEKQKNTLCKKAIPLSNKRKLASDKLSTQIQKELLDLAMKDAKFQVNFSNYTLDDSSIKVTGDIEDVFIGMSGLEKVNFMLSANIGEELRPLENVASGGELSRILLALKQVLAKASSVQTLIFDEIDSGVSGTAAKLIAQKLKYIIHSGSSQILCISHTPQIASQADYHFCVRKQNVEGRTKTFVESVTGDKRINELARMIVGEQSVDQAVDLARDMITSR